MRLTCDFPRVSALPYTPLFAVRGGEEYYPIDDLTDGVWLVTQGGESRIN